MDKWIEFLITQYNLTESSRDSLVPLDNKANIYLLDGLKNNSTQSDSSYIIHVCSYNQSEIYYDLFRTKMDDYITYQPVLVFTDWKQERSLYRKIYDAASAPQKKEFSVWFNSCSVIYTGASQPLYLKTTDGVNFLEYNVDEVKANQLYKHSTDGFIHPSLDGQIYNIRLSEILKLYNVTGKGLFKYNVRYGLDDNRGGAVAITGEQLKFAFQQYIKLALYNAIKLHNPEDSILEQVIDILQLRESLIAQDGVVLPNRFWFYHNGLTIFSSQSVQISSDRISFLPKYVSVINGAQTLTKFFDAFDKICNIELQKIEAIDGFDIQLNEEEILEDIVVKTIILQGKLTSIASITNGLNTQTPLNHDTILGNSDDVFEINKLLDGKVKILKAGEMYYTEYGYSLLDFVKNWLSIFGKPGKSKNYSKNDLETFIADIREDLKSPKKIDEFISKNIILEEAYKWWENTKRERREKAEYSKATQMIASYAKNYFGSFVVFQQEKVKQEISSDFLAQLYEQFEKELIIIQNSNFTVNDFKKDDLFQKLIKVMSSKVELTSTIKAITVEEKQELISKLSDENQSAYTYAKTISHFFNSTSERLPYFRVVSLVNGKAKEAFPFPNSTFNELFELPAKTFSKSLLKTEINKVYPMFVLHKNEDDNTKIDDIDFIPQFSFSQYIQEAEIVYNETASAFKKGDELLFTKSSDDKAFHIRPKAANAEDTIEFTNGELITRRTFWANKKTVESLIRVYLGNETQDNLKNKSSRKSNNSFKLLGLPIGTKLAFLYDENVMVEVADDKNKVKYDDKQYTISGLAKKLLKDFRNRDDEHSVNGWIYFTKNGISLSELRDTIETRNTSNGME